MKGYTMVPNYQLQHLQNTLKKMVSDGVSIDPTSLEIQKMLRTVSAILAFPIRPVENDTAGNQADLSV